jgi:phage-related protein
MFRKTESMTIKEFMNRQYTKKAKSLPSELSMIPLAVMPILSATPAFAEGTAHKVTDAMYDKMLHAFDPLITLVQALAYPVAMVVVLGGALFVMIGNKEKGFTMMQSAGLGYVLVQMTPLVLNILVEAMKSV